jgi:hypothetical protein
VELAQLLPPNIYPVVLHHSRIMTSSSSSSLPLSSLRTDPSAVRLRALGFCGVDDSIHPHQLAMYSQWYPFLEWGILFRPDREGTPRYASPKWVQQLVALAKHPRSPLKLAAHLCQDRVHQVLEGDDGFVLQLQEWGFRRIQINATAVNGVDTSRLAESIPAVLDLIQKYPDLEFIIQKNDETEPLWQGMLNMDGNDQIPSKCGPLGGLPPNVSMLFDESKGTGVLATSWPTPPLQYQIGYAGGIGPNNIDHVLQQVLLVAKGRTVWIDMESRLRSNKNDHDVFDLDKCYQVILAVCEAKLHSHPSFLLPER